MRIISVCQVMRQMIQGTLNGLFVGGNRGVCGLSLHQRALYGWMVDDNTHVLGEHRMLEQHLGVVDSEVFNGRNGNAVHDGNIIGHEVRRLERMNTYEPTLLREYTASKRERRTSHLVSRRNHQRLCLRIHE